MKPEELLDRLAEGEHEQWVAWARAVAGEVSPDRRARWESLYGPYTRLSEEAEEQDRAWARRESGIPGLVS